MAKKRVVKKVLKYTVIFEPAEETGFVATAPALPGCASQGETFEEAVRAIRDAIGGYLAVLKEEKEAIPVEKGETVVTKVTVPYPFSYSV